MSFIIDFQPVGKRKRYRKPVTILEAAREAGIRLKSVCGGKGECGKCRVRVRSGATSPLTETERKTLSSGEIEEGYRLACRTVLQGKARVYLPPSSLTEAQRLLLTGSETRIKVLPTVRKYALQLRPPTLSDTRSDLERIRDGLLAQHSARVTDVDHEVLKTLGTTLREADWKVTCTVAGREITGIDSGDTSSRAFGVAIDLGTTKIALYLVDLVTGQTVDALGLMNPQIIYGEDVISRIDYAMSDSSNRQRLTAVVTKEINASIEELCLKNGISERDILCLSLVGNTAMHHIFLGLPTRQLALAPYVAVMDSALTIKSRELGLSACPGSYVHFPPPIAGFVGSDHVAMLIASGIYQKAGNIMAIDIGTNTEIALKSGGVITCCSCASGPAFEGAHIKQGMRAAPGAIEGILIDPETMAAKVVTINDKRPVGICGSGVLEGIAEMLRAGIINLRGRMAKDRPGVRINEQNQLEFVLVASGDTDVGEDIVITHHDVSEVQLAKAAIRTGFDILLENAGLGPDDIDQVIIAGAFGSYIDPIDALRLGMFPDIPATKFVSVGNAAGVGAKQILISTKWQRRAIKLAKAVRYIELAARPDFSEHFVRALPFG